MGEKKKYRNFPRNSLEESLAVPQKIFDEMGGRPFKRLLLADALGITPSSSNFRDLLSSSYKYGLTEGTEKASEIELTNLGRNATQSKDQGKRKASFKQAVLKPEIFNNFFNNYIDKRIPSSDMLGKILVSEYEVPADYSEECGNLIIENGRFAGIIRDIGGSPHVILDLSEFSTENPSDDSSSGDIGQIPKVDIIESTTPVDTEKIEFDKPPSKSEDNKPRPIFIGHGKNKKPLENFQKFLTTFQIPYKITIEEANLGRPIPYKVRETMYQCGSAILIFTCDEKFFNEDGHEIWRPSENVVHELGAASLLYEDRIVIFKEKGLNFPSNFQSIGYIEFDVDGIEAKTTDLLRELIGFGLVKVTPT